MMGRFSWSKLIIAVLVLVAGIGLFFTMDNEEYDWENDGIVLMQHEIDGDYACFGCNYELCVDPAPVMKPVEENWDRHCNEDFEVVWK